MVTHSFVVRGSMTTSHTRSGGAAMSICAMTTDMGLPRAELLDGLPIEQREGDRAVEWSQRDTQQAGGSVVTWQQIGLQGRHEGSDEVGVLPGDRGADRRGQAAQ